MAYLPRGLDKAEYMTVVKELSREVGLHTGCLYTAG